MLMKQGVAEDELKILDKKVRKTVADAADFAEESPEPELAELYTDVLVEQY
jgi:pyruvate dehydrogenase E1 component alpha subunit